MSEICQDNNGTLPLSAATKNGRLEANANPKTDIDSSENDPCLGRDDPTATKKKLPFYEKRLSDLQDKTGLSRKWVLWLLGLVALVAVLLLVIIGLSIAWPVVPHMFRYPVCRDAQCLRAAAQIQDNLDKSISPCTDLWGFACSKYTGNSSRPLDKAVWNQKEMLIQQESQRIRDIISTLQLPLHIGTVEWKLKHFYEACMDVDSIAIDGARPLTNIILELGGWYILRNWNNVNFDGMKVLINLQARYGVSPFFKIHVEPDPHVPNSHIIRISPSGLGLPDRDYYYRDSDDRVLVAYTDYIRDVVMSLSTTRNDAAKFGKDMFGYEQRIAEITPDLVSLQNPITTYNVVSLGELKLTTSTIPFYDILQALYPEVSITEDTEVIVTSTEYLSQLAQIISTTDRQTLNGYLIWCLVREYMPFLSDNYSASLDSFNAEMFGISKPRKRWEICSGLVRKYMPLASEYHLSIAHPISDSARHVLSETFRTIWNVVREKVVNLDSSDLLVQHLEAKLNTLSFHIGLPASATTSQFLTDYYGSLIVLKSNLFESMRSAVSFQKKIEQKMLMNALPEGVFLKDTLRDAPEVRYVPSRNAIVVPRSLVIEPFFEDGYPRPVLYGRVGVEIAFAVLSSVLPYGSSWTADKKILSPFHMTVNESFKSVKPGVDCLSRHILDSKWNVPSSRVSGTTLTVLMELSAVRTSLEALLASSSAKAHTHYGGLEQYEESALYFLSFTQTRCSDSTEQYRNYENLLNFRLSPRSVLNLAWTHLSEFRKAFDCASSQTATCRIF